MSELEVNKMLLNALAPISIDWHEVDFIFGEQYGQCLIVDGLPKSVKKAWLKTLYDLEGTIVSLHLGPTDSIYEEKKLLNIIKQSKRKKAQSGLENIERNFIEQAENLLQNISIGKEKLVEVSILIIVYGRTKDELCERRKKIELELYKKKITTKGMAYLQEEGIKSAGPFNEKLDKEYLINNIFPTRTILAGFPYQNDRVMDKNGIVLGLDYNQNIIILDTWKHTKQRLNSNWVILGPSGVGKSTFVKHLLINEFAQGTKVIIIDPCGEYRKLGAMVEGQIIDFESSAHYCLNPLDMFENNNFKKLRTFFNFYMGDLTDLDYIFLHQSLTQIKSSYHQVNLKALKEYLECYIREDKEENLFKKNSAYKISMLVENALNSVDNILWSGETKINLDAEFTVFDTSKLNHYDLNIKSAYYYYILNYILGVLENKQERLILAIDEAYLLMNEKVPEALELCNEINRYMRKRDGAFVMISHNVADFLKPSIKSWGAGILQNSCYQMLMGVNGYEIEEIRDIFNLTQEDQYTLLDAKRGEGILCVGNKKTYLKVDIPPFEQEYF